MVPAEVKLLFLAGPPTEVPSTVIHFNVPVYRGVCPIKSLKTTGLHRNLASCQLAWI